MSPSSHLGQLQPQIYKLLSHKFQDINKHVCIIITVSLYLVGNLSTLGG